MDANLNSTLERAARLHGGKTAVIDGDVQLTYSDFERRVAGLDAGLARLGVGPGDVVAVLMMNSHSHLETWFGVPRGGGVLNDLNVRLAPAELQFILGDCDAVALIVDDAFLELGEQLASGSPTVRTLIHAGRKRTPDDAIGYEELVHGPPRSPATFDEETLAGIFYTGGTTGHPKGAMLSHRNLLANAKHTLISWEYVESDRYLHAAPMFHLADGCSTYGLTWCGGTHVIIPAFEPELVIRTIAEERVTRTLLVPTMINMILGNPALEDYDLSSLRRVAYGASPMPAELQRKALSRLSCEWYQAYGMTEAAPLVATCSAEDHRRGAEGEEPYATRLRSAGTPVPGVRAEVRRPDGSIANAGEAGEIWVQGENVMSGYWNRPEETAAVLDEDGWYHSGDAAYQDEDGYLYIVDRVRDMIISGGENVYSSEVENAVYEHEAVMEVAVFGVPDERWGERVHAAIVLREGHRLDEAGVIEHCRGLIAGYKLPRSVEFRDEPLPKSGAGKILKRELRAPHWEGMERRVP
jgi:acyl-CoA synthetase (AMP-forming)/AMP-acid ligase II